MFYEYRSHGIRFEIRSSYRPFFDSYYRHPKTTQERRQWDAMVDEFGDDYKHFIRRRKRSKNHLANAWDDIPFDQSKMPKHHYKPGWWRRNLPRSEWFTITPPCWKVLRKHQYRVVEG